MRIIYFRLEELRLPPELRPRDPEERLAAPPELEREAGRLAELPELDREAGLLAELRELEREEGRLAELRLFPDDLELLAELLPVALLLPLERDDRAREPESPERPELLPEARDDWLGPVLRPDALLLPLERDDRELEPGS